VTQGDDDPQPSESWVTPTEARSVCPIAVLQSHLMEATWTFSRTGVSSWRAGSCGFSWAHSLFWVGPRRSCLGTSKWMWAWREMGWCHLRRATESSQPWLGSSVRCTWSPEQPCAPETGWYRSMTGSGRVSCKRWMKRSPLSAIGSPVCSRACTASAVLQVVAAVEEEFGIEVRDEDLTPEL